MKLAEVLCALIIGLALVVCAPAQDNQTAPDADTARPVLAVDKFGHDFGEVRAGTTLRWTFKIRNVGNADLLIRGVVPDG